MLLKYGGEAADRIGDLNDPNWPPKSLEQYDEMNMLEFLEHEGASPEAQHLIRTIFFAYYGDLGYDISALFFLQQYPDQAGLTGAGDASGEWKTVRGGNDLLPQRLATRLGSGVRYGSPVVAIEHSPTGVTVTCRRGGGY